MPFMPRLPLCLALALALAAASLAALPARAQVACMNEVNAARAPVEKNGLAVKAAIEGKKPPDVICKSLRNFTAAEAKFIKYLEDNASWCAFPAEAIDQVKKGHAHSLKLQSQACKAAAAPRALPTGPGLADALGTSRAAVPDTSRPGRGIFDTLSGNPLQQ